MNRELVLPGGAGVYPLTGDIQSQAGNNTVTVEGLQQIPISQVNMYGGETLSYNIGNHSWTPTLRATIQVNNVTVSTDNIVSLNVPKPVLVNGA